MTGHLIFKPRGQWHTFWNAGDEPRAHPGDHLASRASRNHFRELVELGGVTGAALQTLAGLCERYGLEMDPESVPGLIERFSLRFPGEPLH